MAKGDRRSSLLIGGIFSLIGFVFLGVAGWTGQARYLRMTTWPKVEAEVVSSEVTRQRSSSSSTPMYSVEVVFRYTIEGEEYTTPWSPGYSTSSYSQMRRNASSFQPGQRYPIQYNPEDPNEIEARAGWTFGFFFLPAIFGFIGLVFAIVGLALLKATKAAAPAVCASCGSEVAKGMKFCPNCATPLPPPPFA